LLWITAANPIALHYSNQSHWSALQQPIQWLCSTATDL
jgi:hypothetical protein